MNALFILIGIATTYAGPYIGRPLYCDRSGTLVYTLPSSGNVRSSVLGPRSSWVALDVRLYQTGQAQCGDHLVLFFPPSTGACPERSEGGQEGGQLLALALDAGPFEGYYVADYPNLPIIVDVPAHLASFSGLSSPVRVLNLSALDRAMDHAHAYIVPGD
jgi:hypothetical protein